MSVKLVSACKRRPKLFRRKRPINFTQTRLHRILVVDEVALNNLSKITVISIILSL
jgi:hypothetical protein